MKSISYCIFIKLGLLFLLIPGNGMAQKSMPDSSYIITYPKTLMVRVFMSQKFAPFTIGSQHDHELNYKTNLKLNMGIGATYNNFTANLAYGFKFLNKDKGKGTTKGLDLQIHMYPNNWAIDLLAAFIKGYHLDPKDNNGLNLVNFYQRPDLTRNVAGIAMFRVANANKFSYRAAAIQNEVQARSAGSFLYGGEAYYGSIKSDSALVPPRVNAIYEQDGINKYHLFSIGPGIGYAYTLVIKTHFFITGSLIASADLNFSSEEKTGSKQTKVSIIPGGIFKASAGYNSGTWSFSANIAGNALYSGSAVSSKEYFLPTGNTQLVLAKKLHSKR